MTTPTVTAPINNRFVKERQYKENVKLQKQTNPMTLQELKIYGISDISTLKLEFFFYTNTQEKANNLAIELKKLQYTIERVDTAADDTEQWVITGRTTKITMDVHTITEWTTKMCSLGFDNDCAFDGWGTLPDQDIDREKGLTSE